MLRSQTCAWMRVLATVIRKLQSKQDGLYSFISCCTRIKLDQHTRKFGAAVRCLAVAHGLQGNSGRSTTVGSSGDAINHVDQ